MVYINVVKIELALQLLGWPSGRRFRGFQSGARERQLVNITCIQDSSREYKLNMDFKSQCIRTQTDSAYCAAMFAMAAMAGEGIGLSGREQRNSCAIERWSGRKTVDSLLPRICAGRLNTPDKYG